jgi:uncharacterized repeat protein (TIGR01451 family)
MKFRLGGFAAVTALALLAPASAAFASGGTATTGADLQVSGSSSTGSPAPGAAYSYTFQVKNNGPDSASSVVVNDPLPAGTIYNYATANGSTLPCAAFGDLNGGTTASCNLGTIAKGGQATVVVNVNAPQSASTYSNTGTATSSTSDPVATNNAVTVTVQVKASNKNGINDVVPAAPVPCAGLGGVAAPTGYYSVWAAIWNTFTVRSCSTSSESLNVEVTETNIATGLVDYDVIVPMSLLSGQNISMVLDNDFAPFNTTYTVAMTVTDSTTGTVLATSSIGATTPPPQ